MRKTLAYILGLALIGGLVLFAFIHEKEDKAGYSVKSDSGQTLPNFTFTGLDGKVYQLSDFTGKVVLLNFWASWCPPCREEMPIFKRVYEDCKDKNFVILAVSMDTNAEARDRYLKELKPNFLVLEGNDQVKLIGLPTSYLIDKDGRIYKMHLGVYSNLKEDLKELLGTKC